MRFRNSIPAGLVLMTMAVHVGCSTASLNRARQDYFNGNYQQAAETLAEKDAPRRDRALFLMERGMIRQAAGDFTNSVSDLIQAYNTLADTAPVSITKDTGSLVINDNVQNYRGVPFERTLLHVFTAIGHLQIGHWENSAVEARRIIESLLPDVKKDYPEDAFSRYIAGFCLGMAGDRDNVGLQYRLAQEHVPHLRIDDRTGMITPATGSADKAVPENFSHELVVFVLMGRSPTGEQLLNHHRSIEPVGYAEVIVDGGPNGRSYELADIVSLAFTTKQKDAIREMAKSVSRVAAKETVAYALDDENPLIGALFRLIMIGLLEQPDTRRWETLPRSLQVARIPLNGKPESVTVNFKSYTGNTTRTLSALTPVSGNGRTYIMVVRDTKPVL